MITDLKPYAEFKESGLPWLGQVPSRGLPARDICSLSGATVARRRGILLSNDLEPAHGGLQQVVVILRHCLGYERGDLTVGETGLPCSLAATAEYYKSVSVMPSKRNGDVGIFWRHGIGSSRQSIRQQA